MTEVREAAPPTRTVGSVIIEWLVREMQRAAEAERRRQLALKDTSGSQAAWREAKRENGWP